MLATFTGAIIKKTSQTPGIIDVSDQENSIYETWCCGSRHRREKFPRWKAYSELGRTYQVPKNTRKKAYLLFLQLVHKLNQYYLRIYLELNWSFEQAILQIEPRF